MPYKDALEKAEAELAEWKDLFFEANKRASDFELRLQKTETERDRYRVALEWYGDEDTYRDYYPLTAEPYRRAHILYDSGQRARTALSGEQEKKD
jgi:hypothetical protein